MDNIQRQVLIIEDEYSIRSFIRVNLIRNNFHVLEASSGEDGIRLAMCHHVDIVILDIMLPGIDGYKVCEILRKEFPRIGIVMLTAKSQDMDKITGLEHGADDYVAKPFNPTELMLRIKSLSRRIEDIPVGDKKDIRSGPFTIDVHSKKIYKSGLNIELTPTEYSIMTLFAENPGRAFRRDEILNLVWGYSYIGDSKIVDVNIRRLRAKIEDNPGEPAFIETVWGTGYRWKVYQEEL